jgi:uncharacterized protein (TIGR02466 family)
MKDLALSLFPKTIFIGHLNNSKKQIDEIIKVVSNIKTFKSYQNTPHSKGNLTYVSKDKNVLDKLPKLKTKLYSKFIDFKKNIMAYKNDFKISTSWISKTDKKQQSIYHNHKNSMYSGVYYPTVDEDSAPLLFHHDDYVSFNLETTESNINNSSEIKVTPQSDTVIFFPSGLYHCIGEHLSDKTRYCIAFNLFPVGKLGDADSYVEVQ